MGEAAPGFPPTTFYIWASLPSSWPCHCQNAPSALTPLLTSASPGSKRPLCPSTVQMSAAAWKGRQKGWGRGGKRGEGKCRPGQLSSRMISELEMGMPLISFEVKQHTVSLGRTEEVCLGRMGCNVGRWGGRQGEMYFIIFCLLSSPPS